MTETHRCEPREELRGVDGWHWVRCPEGTEQACRWRGESERWPPYWSGFDGPPNDSQQAYKLGWRYLEPAATPAEVAALRAERDNLRKWLHRSFVVLNEFAGEGLFMTTAEDPAELLMNYTESVGMDDWDLVLAALEPGT